ncbi:hypothetical protein LOK49_LG02G03411 [Camellia lanceoleosa]|uniref:Uncharacterized protein n=1 Tax=Camellia lanceoleosa TaxID=1840588 RepID=A0ACC0INH9_9ERIC|nr:hypothetical protein LOK49_LG02G03411 [Camellia lanceoleosa]
MVIDNYDGYAAITYGGACTINVSAVFLNGDYGDNIKRSFTSLIYHEMTHIWQWYPPMTPTGLIEGIADYTALKAKYYKPEFFARPGSGKRWDQGYSITARFLEYCDGLKPGFLAAMNRKMRNAWILNYFVELVGKPVDQLWREYKAKYAGVGNFTEDTNLGLWREHKDMHCYDAKEETGCQLRTLKK